MTTSLAPSPTDLAAAAELLDASPDFKVLKRLAPRVRYHEERWNLGDPNPVRLGLYVDCETTGLDRELDEIIEFAAVPFTYDATDGLVLDVLPGYSAFEEPKGEISADVIETHAITLDMVRGHRIDDARVNAMAKDANLVVAHNSEFDRPMMERRFPVFAEKHWACSQKDVPWKQYGVNGAKLVHIVGEACGLFYDAHRALDDCIAGVHVLAEAMRWVPMDLSSIPGYALNDGATEGEQPLTALADLLESARTPTVRVWAINSPYEQKERLKTRRPRKYRWSDGSKLRKGWYVDVKPDAVVAEREWLRANVYQGAADQIQLEQFNSRTRYSARMSA